MTEVVVVGLGAVSPAGWGVGSLVEALSVGRPFPTTAVVAAGIPPGGLASSGSSPGCGSLQSGTSHSMRRVPFPANRPSFLAHPRMRRSSPISQFCVGAALEALGGAAIVPTEGDGRRLGLVFCTMTGSVVYSRRFFDEVLREPATASPLLFPETVFNAPASHLAAILGITGRVHTEVGDAGCFLKGLATAALWLRLGAVDRCLVVGAEEADWLIGEGLLHLSRTAVAGEGAGALLLERSVERDGQGGAKIQAVTDPILYGARTTPVDAMRTVRRALTGDAGLHSEEGTLLVDGTGAGGRLDRAERAAWAGWKGSRWSIKAVLGEAWAAGAAWQCVAAAAGLSALSADMAVVSVVGTQEGAMGALFGRNGS